MLDVFVRLDFCEHHVSRKAKTSYVEQMQEVLEKDDVGSFVQLQSCCAYTQLLRVRDGLYLVRQIG